MSFDGVISNEGVVFNEHRRLYRDSYMSYMVSSSKRPQNHPIYSVETDMGPSIFYNDFSLIEEKQEVVEEEKDFLEV